jgi:hypothetical protein
MKVASARVVTTSRYFLAGVREDSASQNKFIKSKSTGMNAYVYESAPAHHPTFLADYNSEFCS